MERSIHLTGGGVGLGGGGTSSRDDKVGDGDETSALVFDGGVDSVEVSWVAVGLGSCR